MPFITVHRHRPACLRAQGVDTPSQTEQLTEPLLGRNPEPLQINLGFFKVKMHRRTALQASLLRRVAPSRPLSEALHSERSGEVDAGSADRRGEPMALDPAQVRANVRAQPDAAGVPMVPRTNQELAAHWTAWAENATGTEDRHGALSRLIRFVETDRQPELDLSGHALTCLPEHFPANVYSLNLDFNALTQLPENLPVGLRLLSVHHNQLASLPENLPPGLEILDVIGNALTRLPQSIITQLGPNCSVYLEGNRLAQRTLNRLNEIINAPGYQGPRFHFSRHRPGVVGRVSRPLAQAVAAWPALAGADAHETRQLWSSFAREEGAADFSLFLDYLRETVNFQHPAFEQNVAQWLVHLQQRPALRRETFLISASSTQSCEDRVSWTFNAMRQARLSFDVQQGDYDNRLPELMRLGRGLFRLEQLEIIAREKVRSLSFVDEIEVYLAYQVKLRKALQLPIDTPDMRYFRLSEVTRDDLSRAQKRVLAAERDGFFDYLANDWQPWQSLMKRLDPAAHALAQEELVEAMGDEFSKRLRVRLLGEGLQRDPDAQRQVGVQVKTEIAKEINGRLTEQFLESHGLLEHARR